MFGRVFPQVVSDLRDDIDCGVTHLVGSVTGQELDGDGVPREPTVFFLFVGSNRALIRIDLRPHHLEDASLRSARDLLRSAADLDARGHRPRLN